MNTPRIDNRFHLATAGLFMVLVSSVALSTMSALEAQTLNQPTAQGTQPVQTPAATGVTANSQAAKVTHVEQIVVTAKRI
jgi:hypothetical protein